MNKILDSRREIFGREKERRVFNIEWGQVWGKAWEKKTENCGKEEYSGLSPLRVSCPQSYPQGFPRAVQTVIRQFTAPTTITTLINIY